MPPAKKATARKAAKKKAPAKRKAAKGRRRRSGLPRRQPRRPRRRLPRSARRRGRPPSARRLPSARRRARRPRRRLRRRLPSARRSQEGREEGREDDCQAQGDAKKAAKKAAKATAKRKATRRKAAKKAPAKRATKRTTRKRTAKNAEPGTRRSQRGPGAPGPFAVFRRSALQIVDTAEGFAGAHAGADACGLRFVADARREGGVLFLGAVVDAHRRSPLAAMARAARRSSARRRRRRARRGRAAPASNRAASAAGAASSPCSGKKCGSRAATIASIVEQTRVAVIGMEPVRSPRVVPEHDVGPRPADDRAHGGALVRAVRRDLRRRSRGSATVRRAEHGRRVSLLGFALLDQRARCRRRRPTCPWRRRCRRTGDVGACRRPLGQRRAAAELDVVGMGADREHAARGERGRPSWSRRAATRAGRRSSGRSTSKPRLVVADDPHFQARPRAASARWRANEPGPYANAKRRVDRNAHTGVPSPRWSGTAPRPRAAPSPATSSSVVANGRSPCTTTTRAQALLAYPCAPGVGGRVERARVVEAREPAVRRTTSRPRRALETMTIGRGAAAAATTASAMRRARATRASSSSAGGEACLAEAEGANRDDDPGVTPAACGEAPCAWRAYATGRGCPLFRGEGRLLSGSALRAALDDRGRGAHPAPGPVILASNHISYLDPLTLAYVADTRRRRVCAILAKAELFDKRRSRLAVARPRTRSRCSGARRTPRHALDAAVDALGRGECVAVFPEGTISLDLEPMAGKSGTARLARAAGVAGRRRSGCGARTASCSRAASRTGRWGVAQTAVVGKPVTVEPDEHVKDATDRIMAAIADCVARARARSIRSSPRRARTRGGSRPPETGRSLRHRSDRRARVKVARDRGRFVGYDGRGARRGQRADDAVGAPARAGRRDRRRPRERRLPPRHPRCPTSLRATASISRRRVAAPTSSCSVCRRTASARCSARRGPHIASDTCPWSACRRASSRGRCDA